MFNDAVSFGFASPATHKEVTHPEMAAILSPRVTIEIHDPVEAARLLVTQTVRYTPGDGQLYRVALEEIDPDSTDLLLVIMLNINSPYPTVHTLRGPRADASWDRWTPGRWQAQHLPENLYPAVVAILGALGWADHEPVFSFDSVREFDN